MAAFNSTIDGMGFEEVNQSSFTDLISGTIVEGTIGSMVNLYIQTAIAAPTINATTVNATTISGGTLIGDTISGTTIRGVNVYGTTSVSGTTVVGNTVSGTTIRGYNIYAQTSLSGVTIIGTTGSFTNLVSEGLISGANVCGVIGSFGDIVATGMISGANIYGTNISGINVYGTTLISGPTLVGVTFSGTNLNLSNKAAIGSCIDIYKAVADGNPEINLGVSATERLNIKSSYATGSQVLQSVDFTTYTTSGALNMGAYNFYVDEYRKVEIGDKGVIIYSDGAGANNALYLNSLDGTPIPGPVGTIIFQGYTDGAGASSDQNYSYIYGGITDSTHNVNYGELNFGVTVSGVELNALTIVEGAPVGTDKLLFMLGGDFVGTDVQIFGDNMDDDNHANHLWITAAEGGASTSGAGYNAGNLYLHAGDASDAFDENYNGGSGGNVIIGGGYGGDGSGTGVNGPTGYVQIGYNKDEATKVIIGSHFATISGTDFSINGSVYDLNGRLRSTLLGSAATNVWGGFVQAGSFITDAGSQGVIIFGTPYSSATSYYINSTSTGSATGFEQSYVSGVRNASGVNFVGAANLRYDWVAVGI